MLGHLQIELPLYGILIFVKALFYCNQFKMLIIIYIQIFMIE
jgi:hypothetical protein